MIRISRFGRHVIRGNGANYIKGRILSRILVMIIIAVILFLTMVFSLVTQASIIVEGADGQDRTFADVNEGEWYTEHVVALVEEGIIDGYTDHTFKPNKTIQVDEFIKTMVVALGYNPGNGATYWAELYIDKALGIGIIGADDFSTYDQAITRGEMAKICQKTVELLEGPKIYTMETKVKNALTDYSDVSNSGYESYILHVYEEGIITGYPDGSYGPSNLLMRSEASTVIRRIIDTSVRRPFVYIEDDIARLASYPRDTSGNYRLATDFETDDEIQVDIDLALGWVDAIYNFDYRATTYEDYRGTLEWYYSPIIGFGGMKADAYLDWSYQMKIDKVYILEAYGVTDKSLVYQSAGSDLVVPVVIYYKFDNANSPNVTEEMGVWYRFDTELVFMGLAESQLEIDMWPHSFWKFAGADDLSDSIKVGE